MPELAVHLATADRNEALAERMASIGEYGWGITCLFYSALHLVEAYLRKTNRLTHTHQERDNQIRRLTELRSIHRRYLRLKQESEHSRYEGWLFSDDFFVSLRDTVYRPVASYLRNLVTA